MNLSELFRKSLHRCSWWKCTSIVNLRGLDLHSNTGNHNPFWWDLCCCLNKQFHISSLFAKEHIHNHHCNNLCQHHIWPTKKKQTDSTFHQKKQIINNIYILTFHDIFPCWALVVLTRHHCRSLLQSCATKCRPGRRHLIAGEVMRLGGKRRGQGCHGSFRGLGG